MAVAGASPGLRAAVVSALVGRGISASEDYDLSDSDLVGLVDLSGLGEPDDIEAALQMNRAAFDNARRAVQRAPQLVAARRAFAELLTTTGRGDEAAEQWQALLEVEPGDSQARQALTPARR